MIKNIKEIKSRLQTLLLYMLRIFPINRRKVLFQSYYGEAFNDNPLMITLKLPDKDLELVWAVTHRLDIPAGIRQVNTSSMRYFYELATSKVWVDNCRKREWVRKRKNQYYIQTWHGNLGNKRTEGAAIDKLAPEYIVRAQRDAHMTDLMISGSSFFTNLIRQYFWYDGEILECGTPRLDSFFSPDPEKLKGIRRKYRIPDGAGVVLYAPTFRNNLDTACYNLDFKRVLETLEEETGTTWYMLVRLHPNVADKAGFIHYTDKILNMTAYPDLYELIPLADVIISDYSSLTFEAGLLRKPVFLFATDLDEYIRERGFYIDIREQPYILAQNNEELIQHIKNFNKEKYEANLKSFNESLGIVEKGNASDQIAERIQEVIRK